MTKHWTIGKRQKQKQKQKQKQTNNDLQSTTHKTKDSITRVLLNTGDEKVRKCISCTTRYTRRVTAKRQVTWLLWKSCLGISIRI